MKYKNTLPHYYWFEDSETCNEDCVQCKSKHEDYFKVCGCREDDGISNWALSDNIPPPSQSCFPILKEACQMQRSRTPKMDFTHELKVKLNTHALSLDYRYAIVFSIMQRRQEYAQNDLTTLRLHSNW